MKYPILFLGLIGLFSACDSPVEPQMQTLRPNEIVHLDEQSFRVDTLIDANGIAQLSFGSEAIPNYYVMQKMQSDSTIDMHIYPDNRFFFIQASDTFIVTKDSLLKDIDQNYLNEALLQGLMPVSLDAETQDYLFEFYIRKPLEEDRFNYELHYQNKQWQLSIVD
ncbi:MAG: hypothetical protein EP332_07805 [Bacteroidetes bacterium]|nr:MAG: hypothetical protein EP332_07805 [Bacteroidota bacterium]